ncbi:MAG TPA: hypothetical protein VFP49_11440, partial [Nitrososphaeraceae archaeon]|nr:hypothetical protein [Nitrososphaeraceae archaeon]
LWICIKPIHKSVLGINISDERNMFVAENFIRSLVDKYGRHTTVYTDGGTWYPQTCTFLHLKHRLHSSLEKSLIERMMQYFKDRTESFDDYYPCNNNNQNCDLQYVYNWIKIFVYAYIILPLQQIRFHFLWNATIILKLTQPFCNTIFIRQIIQNYIKKLIY